MHGSGPHVHTTCIQPVWKQKPLRKKIISAPHISHLYLHLLPFRCNVFVLNKALTSSYIPITCIEDALL